jgi:hypothetical protein
VTCDTKIRPFPNDTEISCDLEPGHDGSHHGVIRDYAYPGSATEMSWENSDRRTYHGDWPGRCEHYAGCVLPSGHRGAHAV